MNDYSILHLIIHAKSSIKFNTVLEKSDRLLGNLCDIFLAITLPGHE